MKEENALNAKHKKQYCNDFFFTIHNVIDGFLDSLTLKIEVIYKKKFKQKFFLLSKSQHNQYLTTQMNDVREGRKTFICTM